MKTRSLLVPALLALALVLPAGMGQHLKAEPAFNADWKKGRETGFPIPRFVSLKAATAHMRIGPSTDYGTAWVYTSRGLPLEITEEYDNWRKVRDADGTTGWMFAPLLSSRRTAVVGPWLKQPVPLRSAPSRSARVVAHLSPEVRLDLVSCDGTWCRADLQKQRLRGYVQQGSLWGVYPGETID